MAPKLWDHDGTLSSDPTPVGPGLIPFLEGIAAAGGKEQQEGARQLIDAIEKYGTVEVWTMG